MAEAFGKCVIEAMSDLARGYCPTYFAVGPVEQGLSGEVGSFDGHGHSIAGYGRDHGEGIADIYSEAIGGLSWRKRKSGDRAKRGVIPLGVLQALGEKRVGLSAEPFFPLCSEIGDRVTRAEQSTNIDLLVFDSTEADVAAR